ncbi:uncharacterized protein EI90DRAFT_3030480, partial [Cantharellus anzutake]|uniref:uncharacterized protein n=1 Tax=Cantharellus anzutake TaxID=1750568 RepID=UPI001903B10B
IFSSCVSDSTLITPCETLYTRILCASREKFLARPTLPAHFHNFSARPGRPSDDARRAPSVSGGWILSGIDLEAGGTWLGINRAGQIGFLCASTTDYVDYLHRINTIIHRTNITEPLDEKKYAVSRGLFVQQYLSHNGSTPLYLFSYLSEHYDRDTARPETGGFNFILFAPKSSKSSGLEYEAALLTNHGACGPLEYRSISADECHNGGISNAIDGSPIDGLGRTGPWLKIDIGRVQFEGIFEAGRSSSPELTGDEQEAALIEALMELMGWSLPSSDSSLDHLRDSIFIPPFNTVPRLSTPVDSDATSSAQPPPTERSKLNGTRLTTIILVRRDGGVCFVERDRSVLKGDGGLDDVAEVFGLGKWETQRLYRFSPR